MMKKILSLVIIAVMAVSSVPAVSVAANVSDESEAVAEETTEIIDDKEDSDIDLENNSEIELMSLLPLEERHAYLVVGDHDGVDISSVPVEVILENLLDSDGNKIEIDQNAKEVWSYYKDCDENVIMDNYFVIEDGGTLDLSLFEEYDRYTLEMIVGDGNQLNPDNIRYIVTVYLADEVRGLRTYELYTQDEDGTRHKIEPDDVVVDSISVGGIASSNRTFIVHDHEDGTEYYLGVNDPLDEHPFIQCDVMSWADYFGYLIYQAYGWEYEYTSLSDQFINQNMNKTDAGYKNNWDTPEITDDSVQVDKTFCFLYKNSLTGDVLSMELITFSVVSDTVSFNDEAYIYENDSQSSVKLTSTSYTSVNEWDYNDFYYVPSDVTHIRRVWLNEGYSADDEYYYTLLAHSPIWENANDHVVKAVVGLYDSLEEAKDAEDIGSQLLPQSLSGSSLGYKANYNIDNGGMYFTVFFDDDTIWKFLVVFSEYDVGVDVDYIREYSDVPVVGEPDPWFRVEGATDTAGVSLDTYVIENGKNINIDTMYGYGYQTMFINEDIDSFIPTFWRANEDSISVEKIFVNGSAFDEGEALSFADGENVLNTIFSVIITDNAGVHTKNYNITFVKKTKGSQLYVAGPLSPEVRSVFLDEYFEYKHDIFIANVGDEAISDLWIDLDAENVELDNYWTIGGSGNNVLAACPDDFSLELESTIYGELSNVAKIRLVPSSEGESGEISGTLKIYSGKEGDAASSELLATIILSGQAQNPTIITDQMEDAVKYVPYSYMITTNNMYDWNEVTFSITEGSIPDGMTFNESTGEIYGAPLKAGNYTFTVQADYSRDDYFEPSRKEFTINVLDNGDETVFKTSDEGYEIVPEEDGDTGYIGEQVSEYDFVLTDLDEDEIYISGGEYDQFVKLWLNGEELSEGTDYITEPGSTRIIIKSQTLKEKTNSGRNTISAEFNINNERGDNLRRTSQNFRIDLSGKDNSSNPADSGNSTKPGSTAAQENQTGSDKVTSINQTGMSSNNEPTVNIITHIVDKNDSPLANYIVEMHSNVKTAITDISGDAVFKEIEVGRHTIYIKNGEGEIVASKKFTLAIGNELSANGDVIIVKPGQTISMTIVVDGSETTIRDVQTIESPKTGDTTKLSGWMAFIAISLISIGYCLLRGRKKQHFSR